MKSSSCITYVAASLSFAALAGCETRHTIVVEQPKPLDININLSGRLELVVTDARQDLEKITGEKPARTVSPEDLGLPAESHPVPPGSTANIPESPALALTDSAVMYLADFRAPVNMATEDELLSRMAKRKEEVRALLDAKVAGEAHTGMLAVRGKISDAQQSILTTENNDRKELYRIRSEKTGVAVEKVALEYYRQRLGYAKKGDWYERFDKSADKWIWAQWQS